MNPKLLLRRLALALLLAASPLLHAADAAWAISTVSGNFADVRENLVNAIQGRGLVINVNSHIGEMLERTGADIGARRRLYGTAEAFEFCSAGASRAMMEADPRHIVFCPFTLSIYTLPETPGEVHIAYRRLPDLPGLNAARNLLADIVREASEP